jgi:murein DD-endopeptidase MepM/ murein hydrolase activator NlpD
MPKTYFAYSSALLIACLSVGSASAAPASGLPVELRIPIAPTPVKVDGATRLLYELHINNLSGQAFELTELEVLKNQPDNALVASYSGAALGKQIMNPGSPEGKATTIAAGAHLVTFIDIKLDGVASIPQGLHHRLSFSLKKPDGSSVTKEMDGASLLIKTSSPIVLQAPVHGSGWLAYDLMETSEKGSHRRTLMAVDGKAAIAQRFAIDWVKFAADGRLYHGPASENVNWAGYGTELLAVADGIIADTKDGIPDNHGNGQPLVPISLDTIGGNFISLDIGGGRYAMYGHMQVGSLRVKTGDKVVAGQVLGLLGNSGQSDGPHLHFHVVDNNSILGAEGLPYVFKSFKHLGTAPDAEKLVESGESWHPSPSTKPLPVSNELPVNFAVLEFP